MQYDRKQYVPSLEYYTRVEPLFEREKLEQADPLGFAEYLEEYATALEQIGKPSDAANRRARAAGLRQSAAGKEQKTEKTPYGTQCSSDG
jgi:hypothetical protein